MAGIFCAGISAGNRFASCCCYIWARSPGSHPATLAGTWWFSSLQDRIWCFCPLLYGIAAVAVLFVPHLRAGTGAVPPGGSRKTPGAGPCPQPVFPISPANSAPLTVILGMVKIRSGGALPPRRRKGVLIRRNGKKLLRLVMVARPVQAGSRRPSVHYVQSDVVLELKYLLESFHSLAEAKKHPPAFFQCFGGDLDGFRPEKLEHLGATCWTTPSSTRPPGEVRLELERLPSSPPLEPVPACSSGRDTGIGILRIGAHLRPLLPGLGVVPGRSQDRAGDGGVRPTCSVGILSWIAGTEGSAFSVYLPLRNPVPNAVVVCRPPAAGRSRRRKRFLAHQLLPACCSSKTTQMWSGIFRLSYRRITI